MLQPPLPLQGGAAWVDDKAAGKPKKRAELTQDAITALTKTQEALTLLDAKKTKEALAALELASGSWNWYWHATPNLLWRRSMYASSPAISTPTWKR